MHLFPEWAPPWLLAGLQAHEVIDNDSSMLQSRSSIFPFRIFHALVFNVVFFARSFFHAYSHLFRLIQISKMVKSRQFNSILAAKKCQYRPILGPFTNCQP